MLMKYKPEHFFIAGQIILLFSVWVIRDSYAKLNNLIVLSIVPFLFIYLLYYIVRSLGRVKFKTKEVTIHFILSFLLLFLGIITIPYLIWHIEGHQVYLYESMSSVELLSI